MACWFYIRASFSTVHSRTSELLKLRRLQKHRWLCGGFLWEFTLTHMLPVPNLLLYMLLILRSPVGLTPFQKTVLRKRSTRSKLRFWMGLSKRNWFGRKASLRCSSGGHPSAGCGRGRNTAPKGPQGWAKGCVSQRCWKVSWYGKILDVVAERPAKQTFLHSDVWKPQFPLSSLPAASLEWTASCLDEP